MGEIGEGKVIIFFFLAQVQVMRVGVWGLDCYRR